MGGLLRQSARGRECYPDSGRSSGIASLPHLARRGENRETLARLVRQSKQGSERGAIMELVDFVFDHTSKLLRETFEANGTPFEGVNAYRQCIGHPEKMRVSDPAFMLGAAIVMLETAHIERASRRANSRSGPSDEQLVGLCLKATEYAAYSAGLNIKKSQRAKLEEVEKAEILRALFSALGKSGVAKRHAPMAELRAWAVSQYQTGKWASANQAAYE